MFGEHYFCTGSHRCQPTVQERCVLMAMNNAHISCPDKAAQVLYEFPVKPGGTGDPVHGNTVLPHLLPDCANLPIDTDYFVFDLLPPATQNQLPYNLLSAPYPHVQRNVEGFRLRGVVVVGAHQSSLFFACSFW